MFLVGWYQRKRFLNIVNSMMLAHITEIFILEIRFLWQNSYIFYWTMSNILDFVTKGHGISYFFTFRWFKFRWFRLRVRTWTNTKKKTKTSKNNLYSRTTWNAREIFWKDSISRCIYARRISSEVSNIK